MDHIILAAEHEGVATCWIETYDSVCLRKALLLKDNERVFSKLLLDIHERVLSRSVLKIESSWKK